MGRVSHKPLPFLHQLQLHRGSKRTRFRRPEPRSLGLRTLPPGRHSQRPLCSTGTHHHLQLPSSSTARSLGHLAVARNQLQWEQGRLVEALVLAGAEAVAGLVQSEAVPGMVGQVAPTLKIQIQLCIRVTQSFHSGISNLTAPKFDAAA